MASPSSVTAVRVAAIAAFELWERKTARIDFDAAQFNRLRALENRHRPYELGCVALAQFAKQGRFGAQWRLGPVLGPVGTGKPHPLGAADRGTAGIGGLEFRVDRIRDFRIGHAPGQIFPQRVRMLRRPVCRLHSLSPARCLSSFRGATRRSNPAFSASLDCFASLAMTVSKLQPVELAAQ